MMTPEEQIELNIFKAEREKIKLRSMDFMLHSVKNGIEFSGHKTVESLLLSTVKRCQLELTKLEAEFLKKFPD